MNKSKKIIKIFFLSISILIISTIIYFSIPRTVLRYSFDDGKVIVYFTEKMDLDPIPTRSSKYTIHIVKKDGLIKKRLLTKEFSMPIDGVGLNDDCVEIEWFDSSVKVTVKGKGRCKIFESDY